MVTTDSQANKPANGGQAGLNDAGRDACATNLQLPMNHQPILVSDTTCEWWGRLAEPSASLSREAKLLVIRSSRRDDRTRNGYRGFVLRPKNYA